MQAIGDVIMNRAEILGTDMATEITASGQVNGYNSSSQSKTAEGRNSNENSKLVMARQATLTTVLGTSRGKSNGAYFWDGADIVSNEHSNVWGIHYTDSSHDIYNTGDKIKDTVVVYYDNGNFRAKYNHKLDSTAAFGGTIFWKKSPDFKKASNRKEYERKL